MVFLRVLRIILVILPEHPSETMVFHNEDGKLLEQHQTSSRYLKDGDGDGKFTGSDTSDYPMAQHDLTLVMKL
ncbi:hypothetical protein Tco_0882150 [Tanacetum coccineum]